MRPEEHVMGLPHIATIVITPTREGVAVRVAKSPAPIRPQTVFGGKLPRDYPNF